ncbi:MAG: MATE family efflux transporter [Gammaproteobacteria bacterium]|nr:MATE family efflux transporter [Gammaproteobacteria bacterium]
MNKHEARPILGKEIKTLLVLMLPIVVSQLAQIGITVTDTIMAGRHSEVSLAGVAVGSSLWVPCFLFLMGVLMATTPIIAHAWGAENSNDIKHSMQQSVWLAIAIGLIMMLITQILRFGFDWMSMENETRIQAKGYLYAVSFGLPALAMFQVLRGLNEGAHLTRPYMYVSLFALLLNIPLNYIFIYGKFGLPEMGGVGCGWATTVVLYIECLIMLVMTLSNKTFAHIPWQRAWSKPQWEKISEILKLGIPIGFSLLIEASMFSLIALFLAQLGSTVVAGHQVAMSFASFLFMVPLSMSLALTIRCGFMLGKGHAHHARYIGYLGLAVTLGTATLGSSIILLFADQIAALYTTDESVRLLAVELLFFAAIFQFSDGLQVATAGILRGYKDTRFAFYVVLTAYWLIGLPLGYSLSLTDIWAPAMGAQGFWVGMIAGLSFAAVLLIGRFLFITMRLKI